jgi:hypothetical protein
MTANDRSSNRKEALLQAPATSVTATHDRLTGAPRKSYSTAAEAGQPIVDSIYWDEV